MIKPHNILRLYRKAMMQPAYAADIAQRRLRAQLSYYIGKGKAPLPEAVTLYLTHLCNLKCHMCGQWGERGSRKDAGVEGLDRVIPLERMESLLDELAGFRPSITLFGGEPLLYPGCAELIKAIKRRGMHCLMITNGTLIERYADELAASGLDELNVSVDGTGDIHDRVRGAPGAYASIMRGLAALRTAGTRAGAKRPLANLQCTVNKLNYDRLALLSDAAREAGAASLTIHNLIFTRRDELVRQRGIDAQLGVSSRDWDGFSADTGIDWAVAYEGMRALRSRKHGFTVDIYPDFSRAQLAAYYTQDPYDPPARASRCLSPWLTAYLFPDGSVRPCLNSTYSFGNINEIPFSTAWNSPSAAAFRGLLRREGRFPLCSRCTELYRY